MTSLITTDMLWRVQKECGAKDEFWQVKTILQSKYHVIVEQSDGAIIEVANHLFGQERYGKWKKYQPNNLMVTILFLLQATADLLRYRWRH